MPWVTPTVVSTGDVLTASEWNQSVVANSLMGIPTFTNEAARDAAITSPAEGQVCALTAPTIPSATGLTIAGLVTVYNGSVWRSSGPLTGAVVTSQDSSGTYGSWLDLATTGPVVTMVTGTSVLCNLSAGTLNNVAGNTNRITVAVSGATTVAAATVASSFGEAIFYFSTANVNVSVSGSILITGLTPGTNTFTMKYQTSANTQRYFYRTLTVIPMP